MVIVTIGMQQTQANYDAQITFGHLIKKITSRVNTRVNA